MQHGQQKQRLFFFVVTEIRINLALGVALAPVQQQLLLHVESLERELCESRTIFSSDFWSISAAVTLPACTDSSVTTANLWCRPPTTFSLP